MFVRKDLKELHRIWEERKDYIENLNEIEVGDYIMVWQMRYSGLSSTSVKSSFKGFNVYLGYVVSKTRKSFVLDIARALYVYQLDDLRKDLDILTYPIERRFYFDSEHRPIKVFKTN